MTQSDIIKRAYCMSLIEENVCSDLKLRFIKVFFFFFQIWFQVNVRMQNDIKLPKDQRRKWVFEFIENNLKN